MHILKSALSDKQIKLIWCLSKVLHKRQVFKTLCIHRKYLKNSLGGSSLLLFIIQFQI